MTAMSIIKEKKWVELMRCTTDKNTDKNIYLKLYNYMWIKKNKKTHTHKLTKSGHT